MKHLFEKTITYQCDLGELTLVELLPDWSKKRGYFPIWKNIVKDLNDGFYLQDKISENHIVIWQTRDKYPANIEVQYQSSEKILINITPSLGSYFFSLIPILIASYALVQNLDSNVYLVCLAFFIFAILLMRFSIYDALYTVKRLLELELRHHNISYQVIDGEPIYPSKTQGKKTN